MIGEIGSPEEVQAVETIAQRGVSIIATAQETSLWSLIGKAKLNALVGGAHQVVFVDR